MLRTHALTHARTHAHTHARNTYIFFLFFFSIVDEPSNIPESLKYESVMLFDMFLNFHSFIPNWSRNCLCGLQKKLFYHAKTNSTISDLLKTNITTIMIACFYFYIKMDLERI